MVASTLPNVSAFVTHSGRYSLFLELQFRLSPQEYHVIPCMYAFFTADGYVASFACGNENANNPIIPNQAWTPYHVRFFLGIIHYQVTWTYSVVGVDDKLVVVQRTCAARLANDLQECYKKTN